MLKKLGSVVLLSLLMALAVWSKPARITRSGSVLFGGAAINIQAKGKDMVEYRLDKELKMPKGMFNGALVDVVLETTAQPGVYHLVSLKHQPVDEVAGRKRLLVWDDVAPHFPGAKGGKDVYTRKFDGKNWEYDYEKGKLAYKSTLYQCDSLEEAENRFESWAHYSFSMAGTDLNWSNSLKLGDQCYAVKAKGDNQVFVWLRKGTRLYGFTSKGLAFRDAASLKRLLVPWVMRKF